MCMVKNNEICTSHILLPISDPKGRMSDQELEKNVKQIGNDLKKNTSMFGFLATQLSIDVATTIRNPKLNQCIIDAQKSPNKDEGKKNALNCMQKFAGNVGCLPKNSLDKDYVRAAEKLKIGEVGYVKTQFGHHLVKRERKGL